MAASRFNDYLTVRKTINDRLMEIVVFSEVASAAEEERQANFTTMEFLGMLGELPDVVRDSSVVLRDNRMSFDEFRYYSLESLRAIRSGGETGDPEMAALWEKLQWMVTFIDHQLHRERSSNNINLGDSWESMISGSVASESVVLVHDNLSQFDQTTSRYVIELLFLQLLQKNLEVRRPESPAKAR